MNDQVIIAVANAITAQAETLKALIAALPKDTVAAVEQRVAKDTPAPAPVAIIETPVAPVVQIATPAVVETTTKPVVETTTNAAMPAAPFPTVAAQAPANPAPTLVAQQPVTPPLVTVSTVPASVSPSDLPFNEHKGMLKYVMDSYQSLGATVGAKIQDVLNSLGTKNINDIKPEQYQALYAGVEALKNG